MKSGKPPMRLPETGQYAVEDDTPEDLARRGKPCARSARQDHAGSNLPSAGNRIGCASASRLLGCRWSSTRSRQQRALRTVDGGSELIQPAELAQFGSEHAVVLREAARIVSLHIYDMAAFNAHCKISPTGGRTISGRGSRQALFRPPGSARDGRFGKCENRLATKAIGSSNARASPGKRHAITERRAAPYPSPGHWRRW